MSQKEVPWMVVMTVLKVLSASLYVPTIVTPTRSLWPVSKCKVLVSWETFHYIDSCGKYGQTARGKYREVYWRGSGDVVGSRLLSSASA